MVTVNRARCGRRARPARPARASYGQAVLLGIATTAVLACGYTNAQVIQHRQLMPSQQQPDLFKRQSNETDGGVGISLSNTALVPGGSSTTTLPQGSSTTALDPSASSSTTTSLDTTTSQTTTSGDTTTTEPTTTTPTTTLPTTTTTQPTTITSSDTTSATSETSQNVVTTIITTTLDNGSIMTSAATATNSAASNNNGDNETTNHKAWIIPLSVVAGIVALSGFLFLGYRCTQRRFSELDDEDGNGIRWPELMQRHDEEGTTLNPLATKRREGAGFDMDEDKNMSQMDLVGDDGLLQARNGRGTPGPTHAEVFANAGLGAPAMAMSRTASSGGSSNGGSANGAGYYGAPQNAYYDPYLGASGAPYPPPQRIMSPNLQQQGGYYDPYQENPDYAPPSPYYPPPSRNANPSGRSSPFQGGERGGGSPHLASPPLGGGPSTMMNTDVGAYQQNPYGEYEDAYHPALEPPMSPAATVNAPRASPPLVQAQNPPPRQSMRLSIANPDGLARD